MIHRTCLTAAAIGLLTLVGAGCAEKMGPVTGIVTLNGKPLPSCTIIFHPVQSGGGKGAPRQANGLTNAEGRYTLETVNDKGAEVGEYKVTFSKKVLPKGVEPPNPADMMKMMEITSKQKESVPTEYTSIKTTPITLTVPSGGKQDADFSLEGQGEITPDGDPIEGSPPSPSS